MYVTSHQIQHGIIRFISQDMLPKVDGWKRVVFGASLDLINDQDITSQLLSSPYISMLGIMDQDGLIDVDRLKSAIEKQIGRDKFDITIPVIGTFKIGQPDLERIYQIIQRGDDM